MECQRGSPAVSPFESVNFVKQWSELNSSRLDGWCGRPRLRHEVAIRLTLSAAPSRFRLCVLLVALVEPRAPWTRVRGIPEQRISRKALVEFAFVIHKVSG